MNILDRIVEQKRRELYRLPQNPVTPQMVRSAIGQRGGTRDFAVALRSAAAKGIGLIAEVKKASPSAGVIRPDFDPVRIAKDYEVAGATCLSVLTDEQFFQGSLQYLKNIRQAVQLPLLRKDFIIDERQILEAAQWGADAILLIVAILDDSRLRFLHDFALEAGLSVLVEVHDAVELDRALAIQPELVGVNNRDLKTFTVDLGTTEKLAEQLWREFEGKNVHPLLVAESGIHKHADIERLGRCGAGAVLVGETLMRQPDVRAAVVRLMGR